MRSTNATRILLDTVTSSLDLWVSTSPWGVAYSGGRDSAVLLWALARLSSPERLTALHVDHGWRSDAERQEEKAVVTAWCRSLGVSLRTYPPPVSVSKTEAAARAHRFACFQSFLSEFPSSPVFLAHHADDQAETVLMRLLKGRSWQGLQGMAPRRGAYLRPLLGLRSSLLAEVAALERIPFHQDSSNTDLHFSRNHLRHTVFPEMVRGFPGAVEALNEFASAWSQVSPDGALDERWTIAGSKATVATAVWDGWNRLERQAQLMAAAREMAGTCRFGRRFLETVTRPGRTGRGQGAGWSWSRKGLEVRWERVVLPSSKEYFILAERGKEYELETYRMRWTATAAESMDDGGIFVEGPDPLQPIVWRSAFPGMQFSSLGEPDWGKERRRKRLGSLEPSRCALILQGGLLRAAVDPMENRVLWNETGVGKLHKTGIFVKLIGRSDYERR